MTDPFALSTLLAAAAGVGVVHTLLGPDHWLPLLGVAKAGRMPRARALRATALLGVVHCAASLLLVPVAAWLADGGARVLGWQDARQALLPWLFLGLGLALLGTAWRARRGEVTAVRAGRWLPVLFALGPCEWLLPNGLLAWHAHGAGAALLTGLVFTASTVATMVAVVAVGLRCVPDRFAAGRAGAWLPGAAVAASGALLLLGC